MGKIAALPGPVHLIFMQIRKAFDLVHLNRSATLSNINTFRLTRSAEALLAGQQGLKCQNSIRDGWKVH